MDGDEICNNSDDESSFVNESCDVLEMFLLILNAHGHP